VRAEALCFEPKIPDSSETGGPDPIRFSVAQTKKARQILTDLSGYLAKPDQRHWWSGKNYDQNFIVPTAAVRKTKHLLHGTAIAHSRE
jgi:hypothetical protein